MNFPLFRMSETEMVAFVTALHRDHSGSFMCNKNTLPIEIKAKIRETLYKMSGETYIALEDVIKLSVPTRDRKSARYKLRREWAEALMAYNNVVCYVGPLHGFYQGIALKHTSQARHCIGEMLEHTGTGFVYDSMLEKFSIADGRIAHIIRNTEEFCKPHDGLEMYTYMSFTVEIVRDVKR